MSLPTDIEGIHEEKWTQSPALRYATMHELADRVAMLKHPDSGITFHRAKHGAKDDPRGAVTNLFSRFQLEKKLSILTMPGLRWAFERTLIEQREVERIFVAGSAEWADGKIRERNTHKPLPPLSDCDMLRRTYITAIERNEAIYRAAVRKMPGVESNLKQIPSPPFATTSLCTSLVPRFHRCTFEDLARFYLGRNAYRFDAAWLDFSGPLIPETRQLIEKMWCIKKIAWRLVITAEGARWPLGDPVRTVDQYVAWIESFPGKRLHLLRYQDGRTPMVQFAIEQR